jgi:hypothetical protein
MWYPNRELGEAARLLAKKERGLALSHMTTESSFLPKYWLNYKPWMYHYGRALLREADQESDEIFDKRMPNGESLWDFLYRQQPPLASDRPWFLNDPYYIRNQQFQLLRMDWEVYKDYFPYHRPNEKVPHLTPSKHKGAWLINGYPMICDDEYLDSLGYLPRLFKPGRVT